LIPCIDREIVGSQTQLVNFDLDNEKFDPFELGFTFAVGLKNPIDPKIGSLNLNWEKREWIND